MIRSAAVATVTAAVVAAIYLLRLDGYAGLMLDDAWYMVLAKSLSSGEGFRLISSSAAPLLPSVPPGFPAALSAVFLVNPSYPDNVLALKAVSLIAMAGVGAACWFDLTRHRGVPAGDAVWMVAAILLIPAFVFLATSTVMAEAVFTLAQMAAVIAVEQAVRGDRRDLRAPLVAGVLAAAAFLVRTAGLAVVAASLVYLVAQRRGRQAVLFAAVAVAATAPWLVYARSHAPTQDERLAHGGSIAYSYEQLLAMDQPGAVNTETSTTEFAERAAGNMGDMLTRDVGAVILPALYRGPSESGEETISVGRPGRGSMGGATGTMILSTLLCLVMAAGVVRARAWLSLPVLLITSSLPMIAVVGSQTFRYVLPLAPFLVWLLWRGVAHPPAARVVVLTILGLQLIDHSFYIRAASNGAAVWIGAAKEIDQVVNYIATQLPGEGAIASSNPGLVFLRTGRTGVVNTFPETNWDRWKRSGVRYVVALRRTEWPRDRFKTRVLFQTQGRLWVVEM